jgi:type IV secretion system protein TrbG
MGTDKSGLSFLLLCTSALAGCAAMQKPSDISYDDAVPAVPTVDPPVPLKVVELPNRCRFPVS